MLRNRTIWPLALLFASAVGVAEAQSSKAPPAPARPAAAAARPANATASCKDGTWWTNAARQGACSSHGGVKEWLTTAAPAAPPANATARCNDGSYWTQAMQGACSGHGGVKDRLGGHPAAAGAANRSPAAPAPAPTGSSKAPGTTKRP